MTRLLLAIEGAVLLIVFAALPCGPPHETVIQQTAIEMQKAPPAAHTENSTAVKSIALCNLRITEAEAEDLWHIIKDTVKRFKADPTYSGGAVEAVTPELVLSVILVESGARITAHSKAGAMGLMQIVPVHHLESLYNAGILSKKDKNELWDTERNVTAGTYILMRYAMRSRNIAEALARYNAGRRVAAGMKYARRVLKMRDRIANKQGG